MPTLPLKAGNLDHWAYLLSQGEIDGNEFNEPTDAPIESSGFWCSIEPLPKGEAYVEGGRPGSRITAMLVARWRPDVVFGSRLKVDDMTLNVERVAPLGRREAIEIWCSEAKVA